MPQQRPNRFDYNLIVIGGGSAGLVAALIATTLRARVALVEKNAMGGECLNTGCVPSKALIRTAKMLAYARRAKDFGLRSNQVDYDFGEVMERVQRVIGQIAPHDSVERFSKLGVECIHGTATVLDPWRVRIGEQLLSTRNIIIATGSRPRIPDLPGLSDTDYLTSDTLWALRERPKRLLILGGGAIGCELSQALSRLDCSVTQVFRGPRLLPAEDHEVSDCIHTSLAQDGVQLRAEHRPIAIDTLADGSRVLRCQYRDDEVSIGFDRLLLATGRVPNIHGLGLEALGLELNNAGAPDCNAFLQTNIPSIYCAGDVAGPFQFTHTASHQAWYASINALFGGLKRFKVDYRVIPRVTFTDPEVARVGLNQSEAEAQCIPFEVTLYPMTESDRAITDGETRGFIKVLTVPGKDRILGVTIVASHAGETIAEFVLAMRNKLGLNRILSTIHSYPTLAEASKAVAGQWRKDHAPQRVLKWVERLQRRRRGG